MDISGFPAMFILHNRLFLDFKIVKGIILDHFLDIFFEEFEKLLNLKSFNEIISNCFYVFGINL